MRGLWNPPPWTGALALVTYFSDIGVSSTLLPFFLTDSIGIEREWAGRLFAVQYASATLGLMITGWISDSVGHRRTLIAVMLAQAAVLNVQGHCSSLSALIACRVVQGFFASYGLALSWVAHVSAPANLNRNLAVAIFAAQGSISLGGLVAGQLSGQQFWIANLVQSSVPLSNAITLSLSCEPVVHSPPVADVPRPLEGLRTIARSSRVFVAAAFTTFAMGCSIGLLTTLSPLLLKEDYGLPQSDIGRVFLVGGVAALCCHATVTPYFCKSHPEASVLVFSLLNVGVIAALAGWNWSAAALLFSLTVYSYVTTAVSLGVCNFLIARAARTIAPEAVAVATGITRSLFTLGQAVMPLLSVQLRAAAGEWLPFTMQALLFGMAGVAMAFARSNAPKAVPAIEVGTSTVPALDAQDQSQV